MTNRFALGEKNKQAFFEFLLGEGLAEKDTDGNIKTKAMTFDELYSVHEKFNKYQAEHEIAPVKASARKAPEILLDRTKTGRKLQDKDELPALYDENYPTRFTTAKVKAQEVKTVVTLSFVASKEWEQYLPANNKLRPFDMVILTHAATLFKAGNKVISTDMLWRQMNGGADKKPTDKMRNEMYDSFCRLGQTWLYIDASEEKQAGLNDRREFRGALLPCGMVIGNVIVNGKPAHDCIKIYDTSPLLDYAHAKGQISPVKVEMYNLPVTRTEENMLLIEYLIGAYADMRNARSDRNKNILSYQTIYDTLGVEDNGKASTRTIKARIRTTVKDILSAWVDGGFIKGYRELTADNNPLKSGFQAAKIFVEFYTFKELKNKDDSEK